MSDLNPIIAQMRRLYLHALYGATVTAEDLSLVVASLEGVQGRLRPLKSPDSALLQVELDELNARAKRLQTRVESGDV